MTEFPPPSLKPIAEEVAALLKSKKQMVAVAETAAGGLISSTLLSVSGASAYYKGGLTLYTLPSRIAYSGWTQANIKAYSGPTQEIVDGLAKHTLQQLEPTYCIAESGTAGPNASGEGKNRQPGFLAIAVAFIRRDEKQPTAVTKDLNTGSSSREENMVLFAKAALELLRDIIKYELTA